MGYTECLQKVHEHFCSIYRPNIDPHFEKYVANIDQNHKVSEKYEHGQNLAKIKQENDLQAGKMSRFSDDFHALFGYILGKYRLSKKLCSTYRPEFAKWSIYRPAIILWTTVDTLAYELGPDAVYSLQILKFSNQYFKF